MRILDDAEVDGLDTVGGSLRIVLLQGSDEPGAHVAHGSLAVLKGTGVMQAGGLLLAVVGDNAVSLLGQDLLVVRLQEVVVAVDNGELDVLSIKDIPGYSNLINLGMLEPLSGKLTTDESKFNGVLEQLTAQDGNYYAVPFRSDFWVVYYNKDIFDQAGVEYPTNDMTCLLYTSDAADEL